MMHRSNLFCYLFVVIEVNLPRQTMSWYRNSTHSSVKRFLFCLKFWLYWVKRLLTRSTKLCEFALAMKYSGITSMSIMLLRFSIDRHNKKC